MWIITHYVDTNITMFEFETEEEAREAFQNMRGCKILTEIVYIDNSQLITV